MVHQAPTTKRLSFGAYRLRAEELRAIAGGVTLVETREFLLGIAHDYDRMASYGEYMVGCRERLAEVSEQLDKSSVEVSVAEADDFDSTVDHSAEACRTMAADALRLSALAEESSRNAWLQLSERWQKLAARLEREERGGEEDETASPHLLKR